MFAFPGAWKIYLAVEAVDMRKHFDCGPLRSSSWARIPETGRCLFLRTRSATG
jgi:hypothetical protein